MSQSAEKAYQLIHDAIVNGRHAPGEHLKEEELSLTTGVSRTPVREALRRLANEGLVVFTRNQGTFVARFDLDDIDEVFDLRAMLEAHGAARAAAHISSDQIDQLEQLTAEMEALRGSEFRRANDAGDGAYVHEFHRLNLEFHKIIIDAANSQRLEAMLAAVIDIPLILMKHYNWDALVDLERSCQQHRELIASFRARDRDWAQSLMRAHVLGARGDRRSYPALARPGPTGPAKPTDTVQAAE